MKTSVKIGITTAIGALAAFGLASPASASPQYDVLSPDLTPNIEHTIAGTNYAVDAYNASLDSTAEYVYASKLYSR